MTHRDTVLVLPARLDATADRVVTELGRLPKVGDVVRTEQGTLEVLRLDGRRIDRLRFRADPDAPANGVETAAGPLFAGSDAARSDVAAERTGRAP